MCNLLFRAVFQGDPKQLVLSGTRLPLGVVLQVHIEDVGICL